MRHLFLTLCLLTATLASFATNDPWSKEGNGTLVLRKFAHEYLLAMEDSTTVILPVVEQDDGSFLIKFSGPIPMFPDVLINKASTVIDSSGVSNHLRVETLNCGTDSVAHSFEHSPVPKENIQACGGRVLPTGCYEIQVRILDRPTPVKELTAATNAADTGTSPWVWVVVALGLGIFVLLLVRKRKAPIPSYPIGDFIFHENSRLLVRGDEQFELTGKEHQLLLILAKNVNDIMTKEELLNRVWQDNGKYEGRTLDVYISRLRKMLEQDPSVKLLSIKGIGYKLQVGGGASRKFTGVLQSITRLFLREAS